MKTVIIKYNAGNIRSVTFALERIGIEPIITDDIAEMSTADKVIFPGVGEASSAMNYLREKKLDIVIRELKQPVLGICLGMQLMCTSSEEGDTKCLGVFNQKIKLFKSTESKVPQIGWNTIFDLKTDLFKGIKENEYQYCVHSYYAEMGENTIATTNYDLNYSSALRKNNFYGVQFHPEKSGVVGETILQNFIKL
ncbi:MAG: imidazole glycerol phosphate synthase subunit HisH [Bacteroidota bacterium]|nr:imidazole glycerol phosphate synthase subunit HisH [Bacteroidota bacterium]MDP3146617.1 imidazole glycerol phosphate synthase subunit HisH [Bacteroidota bacterium]MDP3556190.1 imidazole glycerol phosphate synthase subunit HisH [Bacteroidota bacterium]